MFIHFTIFSTYRNLLSIPLFLESFQRIVTNANRLFLFVSFLIQYLQLQFWQRSWTMCVHYNIAKSKLEFVHPLWLQIWITMTGFEITTQMRENSECLKNESNNQHKEIYIGISKTYYCKLLSHDIRYHCYYYHIF